MYESIPTILTVDLIGTDPDKTYVTSYQFLTMCIIPLQHNVQSTLSYLSHSLLHNDQPIWLFNFLG